MVPKSAKRFSDDIMLKVLDLAEIRRDSRSIGLPWQWHKPTQI
jgi:hypothetical protein